MSAAPPEIPFGDLRAHTRAIEADLRAAIDRVLGRGWYVLGEELEAFEREFAAWLGAPHAVGVGSGTDAIALALRALGIGPGHEVVAPANTCVPTVAAIAAAGAVPVLADADPATLTLDPADAARRITPRTRAIVPVHLYGHPCDMDAIAALARAHGLAIVEDCAQAHGARYKGRPCGTLGDAAAFSFYPTKNLGALGDAGAVAARDAAVAERVRQLRNYGEDRRYHSVAQGANSRLDELQAAVLRAQLPHLDAWNAARRAHAAQYARALGGLGLELPREAPWAESCWHLYVVRSGARDALAARLHAAGIGTAVHYPAPIHGHPAYAQLAAPGSLPVSEAASRCVLSLPLYPELDPEAPARIAAAIAACRV